MSIYSSLTSFLSSLSHMLYLLDSSVKYIYMSFYSCALVYQDLQQCLRNVTIDL